MCSNIRYETKRIYFNLIEKKQKKQNNSKQTKRAEKETIINRIRKQI